MSIKNLKLHLFDSIFLNQCIASPTISIKSVAKILEQSGNKIVLLIDQDNKLIGICTDGDLRKAILGGVDTSNQISEILNSNPIKICKDTDHNEIISLMKRHSIFQIPLVDTNNTLIGLYVDIEQDVFAKIDPVLVIMAGGLGQRLYPHTLDTPKPLLKVANVPIIERIINKASSEGIKRIVISVNYKKDQLISLFGSGENFGVSIDYVEEPTRLGTAGSIAYLPKKYLDSTLLVTNGDILHEDSYMKFISHHKAHDAIATMVAKQFTIKHPYGVIEVDGMTIRGFLEKPSYSELINAGIYVLDPQCIQEIEKKYFTMPELFMKLSKDFGKRVIIYPMSEVWFDVGTPRDWNAADDFYSQKKQGV